MLYTLISQNFAALNTAKRKARTCISVFFRGFITIVSDENPRTADNTMLWSIYLATSELFIYKCLTSRHRLGSPRLLSRFLFLFLLSRNLRATWVYCGPWSKAEWGNAGKDRTKV